MSSHFDALIIGAGQAGPCLASRFAAAGQKVALVERKLFGGTCVNTGCSPTKTMVASANAAQLARRGAEYGVTSAGGFSIDMARVQARKNAVVQEKRTSLENWLRSIENCTVLTGQARFESPHEVSIRSERITADRIFLNVGGRALIPDMPGREQVEYFTNSTLLDVDFVPPHLIVVGGSYVGLEFAQIFRRFGSEVTVIEKSSRLVCREDPDVSVAIHGILENEGIQLRLNAACISFAARAAGGADRLRNGGARGCGQSCVARRRPRAKHRRSGAGERRSRMRSARLHQS